MQTVIYLHGFASSPASKKATIFRVPLEAHGVRYVVPDLNVPDFEHLTLTAMLERVAETIRDIPDDGPLYLVGSSMGALVALHFHDRYRETPEGQRVRKLVLLAPGFDFMDNRDRTIGEHWREQWEAKGAWPFFNYALGREVPVHYGLIKDLAHYDSYAVTLDIPVLIYHGTEDTVVHPDQSHRFIELYTTNVTLHWVDSDHELLNATQQILEGMSAFFDLDLLPDSPDVSVREER
jgi:uncharacterized protein